MVPYGSPEDIGVYNLLGDSVWELTKDLECSFSFEIKRTPFVSSERSKSKISIKIFESN